MHLSGSGHVCHRAQVVHLAHCHSNRGRRQADGKQGVGHQHEGQVQPCPRGDGGQSRRETGQERGERKREADAEMCVSIIKLKKIIKFALTFQILHYIFHIEIK